MVTRRAIIEQVALLLYEQHSALLAYGGTGLTFRDAADRNMIGWTVETPAPLGNVLRTEGIVLSDAEIEHAWARALDYAKGND